MLTKEEALVSLKRLGVKPGDTIFTVLRHRRGNHRRISLIVIKKNEPKSLDHIAEALGVAKHRKVTRYGMNAKPYEDYEEGLVTSGGGMDMGYHLVHQFGRALAKAEGRQRNSATHPDPGYDFNHRWL
jgi:hypothetical protein